MQGGTGEPKILIQRDAHDVGVPRRHRVEVCARDADATVVLTLRIPLHRRAIDAVEQVRCAVGGAHGRAVRVVATGSGLYVCGVAALQRAGRRVEATGGAGAASRIAARESRQVYERKRNQ